MSRQRLVETTVPNPCTMQHQLLTVQAAVALMWWCVPLKGWYVTLMQYTAMRPSDATALMRIWRSMLDCTCSSSARMQMLPSWNLRFLVLYNQRTRLMTACYADDPQSICCSVLGGVHTITIWKGSKSAMLFMLVMSGYRCSSLERP